MPFSRYSRNSQSLNKFLRTYLAGSRFVSPHGRETSISEKVHNVSGVLPVSYSTYRGPFTAVKWAGRDVEHSLQSKADVGNRWSYTTSPAHIFMANERDFSLFLYFLS